MTTAHDIERSLYDWAPRELAMAWDNVGLLVGDPAQEVRRILVALDITQGVAEEAVSLGAQMIVSHHPVMNCAWHEVQTHESGCCGRRRERLSGARAGSFGPFHAQ